MAPRRNNRRNRNNSKNQIIELLKRLIRLHSCWNCHGIGHTRYHCPHPKTIFCSYCKNPGVRTIDCRCFKSLSNCRPNHPPVSTSTAAVVSHDQLIMMPPSNETNKYQENILITIENKDESESEREVDENTEDTDGTEFLELDAEPDSFDDI